MVGLIQATCASSRVYSPRHDADESSASPSPSCGPFCLGTGRYVPPHPADVPSSPLRFSGSYLHPKWPLLNLRVRLAFLVWHLKHGCRTAKAQRRWGITPIHSHGFRYSTSFDSVRPAAIIVTIVAKLQRRLQLKLPGILFRRGFLAPYELHIEGRPIQKFLSRAKFSVIFS